MRVFGAVILTMTLSIPSALFAEEEGIRASAIRLAEAEGRAVQQSDVRGTRRSMGRVALGLAMAGAGAAMLLIDPKQPVQPTQPGVVPDSVLIEETAAFLTSNLFAKSVADRGTTFTCYPNFLRSCEFTLDAYVKGAVDGGIVGAAGALVVATAGDRMIYADQFKPFIPFKERSAGMKYGGAALAITGALIAGFWSDVPVMSDLAVAPTPGGLQVGSSFDF